jgi:hypothetical protein
MTLRIYVNVALASLVTHDDEGFWSAYDCLVKDRYNHYAEELERMYYEIGINNGENL